MLFFTCLMYIININTNSLQLAATQGAWSSYVLYPFSCCAWHISNVACYIKCNRSWNTSTKRHSKHKPQLAAANALKTSYVYTYHVHTHSEYIVYAHIVAQCVKCAISLLSVCSCLQFRFVLSSFC
jgi:hypothetical protein